MEIYEVMVRFWVVKEILINENLLYGKWRNHVTVHPERNMNVCAVFMEIDRIVEFRF